MGPILFAAHHACILQSCQASSKACKCAWPLNTTLPAVSRAPAPLPAPQPIMPPEMPVEHACREPPARLASSAAAAEPSAKSADACLPEGGESTVEAAFPGSFCAELWRSVAPIYSATLAHPFLQGLVDGSLDESLFRIYVVQDALYLREYARALALLASRVPRPEWTAFLARCAQEAVEVEGAFHEEFLIFYGTSVKEETALTVRSPNNSLYTSFLLATVLERSFYEGLAAVLPCFVVYLEVGKALKRKGSPHPLYANWIDKYGGADFEKHVFQVVQMVNEAAEDLGEAQRGHMRALFEQGCRLEYMFWDGAYTRQGWPV